MVVGRSRVHAGEKEKNIMKLLFIPSPNITAAKRPLLSPQATTTKQEGNIWGDMATNLVN